MEIRVQDWIFQIDPEMTYLHTSQNAEDHCNCGYCRNYYDCVDMVYPELRSFLMQYGVVLEGPSELLPFEPTRILACYKVYGTVIQWGSSALYAGSVTISIETDDNGTFFIWAGEMYLPWCQEEAEEDVVSPANLPEFLERMRQIWYLRYAQEYTIS